ncbi:hypothetical protein QBD00_004803 [Ochrobactrum sp. AN78]|nr:hypothetical protein [Ochrobactrum sp. AN78]
MRPKPRNLEGLPASTRIMDMASWYELHGYCNHCGHIGPIEYRIILRKFGTHTYFVDLHKRMRCTHCKSKGEGQFGVTKMPR